MNHSSDPNSKKSNLLTTWLDSSDDHLIIVVFFAEWAGSVEILRGFMDRVQHNYPDVEVHWVDIEQQQDLSLDLGVAAIPSTIFLKDREVVDHISGVIPRRKIEERMKPYL
ncbi:thioredoxin family protein [Neolewinella persica]|uniref:thioredoxin family protein n=1 Tax=Neolewinella persica TaxID=70998 RepID=UPI0003640759|nr:thioredoxin family protein [Neolewinella persica]